MARARNTQSPASAWDSVGAIAAITAKVNASCFLVIPFC